MNYICKDNGRPGCLVEPDPRYTMRFDDIGERPIYWCTHCGREAAFLARKIEEAFQTRPGFAEQFREAIEQHGDKKTAAEDREGAG